MEIHNLSSKVDSEKLDKNEEDVEETDLYGLKPYFDRKANKKPQKITIKLIMDRNLTQVLQERINAESISREEAAEIKARELLKLSRIHLDRERIDEIDNLVEYLGNVTHLYLNVNLITKIENLELFKTLTFLILSDNKIEKIENIKMLQSLKLIDLSSNLIDIFDVEELPKNLSFLDLRENTCLKNGNWKKENYDDRIKRHLHCLCQLNGEELVDASDESDSDSREIEPTNTELKKKTFETEKTDEAQVTNEVDVVHKNILVRSKLRQKSDQINLEKESQKRQAKLESIRKSISEKFSSK
jgi:Leucine-rich repeat (LRR) protein